MGHLAVQGSDELDSVTGHAQRIREVHLHDATPWSPEHGQRPHDHVALGQGETELWGLPDQLEQISFDGPVILELNSRSDLEASLGHLERNL